MTKRAIEVDCTLWELYTKEFQKVCLILLHKFSGCRFDFLGLVIAIGDSYLPMSKNDSL